MDLPKQVGWQMRGLINHGGTTKQLEDALDIATNIIDIVGVQLRNPLPKAEDVIHVKNLV